MTDSEKAKAYDEALEKARKELNTCGSLDCDAARQIFRFFPQLAESEDERIRKYLIEELKVAKSVGELKFIIQQPTREECIAYLEKQKYNRMKPVYDNQESFESALEKAWKEYNDSGSRTVDSCEDDYIECAHAKGFREGYLFGIEKQKVNPEEPKIAFGDWEDKEKQEAIITCLQYMRFIKKITNQEYDDLAKWLDSNLVCNLEIPEGDVTPEEDGSFNEDKFLERELSAFLQNYDKEYDDDAAVSDVARHFYEIGKKQKEQKPVDDKAFEEWIDDWYQGSKEAGGDIVMSEAEFKNWSRGIRNMYQQKPAEKHDLVAQLKEHLANTPKEQLEAEWKELEPWGNIGPTVEEYLYGTPAEWSEEDEKILDSLIRLYSMEYSEYVCPWANGDITYGDVVNFLKSLRPSWKPSEEQIYSLGTVVKGSGDCIVGSVGYHLKELYEQLKKLM